MNVFKKIALMLLIAGSCATTTAVAQSKKDTKFAECTAKDGLMEVKMAQLALTKASNPEIKTHAQHMIDDHSKANAELKKIAVRKNIALPTSLNEKQQKCYDKYAAMEPEKFDKKYAKLMKRDHKKAVCMFKKQAKRGDDSELTSFAASKVPTLEHHLDMWKDVVKNLKDDNSRSVTSK